MRYKVNFHVLLYFLISYSTMMVGSQATNLLHDGKSKTSTSDTKESYTFFINVNNNSNQYSNDGTTAAQSQRIVHLGSSTNDRIATALATNNETNHTKIQTSKFI